MNHRKIRVLIVDDSAVIRTLLSSLLKRDPEIEVVGTAVDPFNARKKVLELKPDVITLDIEMPRMDGLTFLEKIMEYAPTPTLIFSSLSKKGSETSLRAYELGAVAVMEKPSIRLQSELDQIAAKLIHEVKIAGRSRVKALAARKQARIHTPISRLKNMALAETSHKVLAIASSTGGTEALKTLVQGLPPDIPGTAIVQHLPAAFTQPLAARLNDYAPFEVRQACHGDFLLPGLVLLAPGDQHLEIIRDGGRYRVVLHQKPPLHGVRPAADYLMHSVAKWAGQNAIGVILTGMGKDGAQGLKAMREAGAINIAQDEKSCVVFGMPKAAIEVGAIDHVCALEDIPQRIVECLQGRSRKVAS